MFRQLVLPSFKTPREPRQGGISDARSSSIKQNLITTKIGSLVLLIITKNILSSGVCGFQCKCKRKGYTQACIFEYNSYRLLICVCIRVCIRRIKAISFPTVAGVSLMRPPNGPHILSTFIGLQEASQTNINRASRGR